MPLSEKDFINRCKFLIEEKLNWEKSNNWKQRDYEYLNDLIFEETNVDLSISTLKRFWDEKNKSLPRPTTLDPLAKFINYSNWYEFKKDQTEYLNSNISNEKRIIGKRKKFRLNPKYVFASIILIIAFAAIFTVGINSKYNTEEHFEKVTFGFKKSVENKVPNSVIFNYDISSIHSDSVFIQQSWDGRNKKLIDKENKFLTSLYYYPGFHKAKLIVDDKIIREEKIHIITDEWLGIVRYKQLDLIPTYIDKKDFAQNDFLYISEEKLVEKNIDINAEQFIVSFYNVRDFQNTSSDNFILETEIKNDSQKGFRACRKAEIIVMCEESRIVIPLSEPGCVSNIDIKTPDEWLYGTQNDFSNFGCDLINWNKLTLQIKNKVISISLNGEKIFNKIYKNSAGKIKGINFNFYGTGSVNYLKLLNGNLETVYFSNFKK